ncbi:MAG: MATE family efflux transporter [Planctomycetes bacterium]|nr:MATE family efflux transporter [Planctomycetota bacterium]
MNAAPEAPARTFWQYVASSLRGEHHDFTTLPLPRAIVLLAVPMVLEMGLESLFALVNTFWVNGIDKGLFGATSTHGAGIAAIGMTEGMVSLVYAVAWGLAIAVTAMVSRRVGEKDLDGAAAAASQAIGLALVVGVVIAVPAAIFAPELLALMSEDGSNAVAIGSGYARWTFASTPIITLLFLQNAIFRGAGDPMLALKVLLLSNGLNLLLDPLLIFGLGPFPALGVEGAAIATCISRGLAVLLQFVLLRRGHCRVPMPTLMRFHGAQMLQIVRLSLGTIGQFLIGCVSWLLLTKFVNEFGDQAGAGYTTGIRILMFALLPAWGLSNAAATLVGQNLGARRPDRAERAVWLTGLYDMAFLAVVTLVMELFPEAIVGGFVADEVVRTHAIATLRIVAAGYVCYAWGMVAVQAFNGAGDTATPTWLHFVAFWVFQIPLAALLAFGLDYGMHGVVWAIPIAESLFAVAAVLLFRRGRWKNMQV